MEEECTLSSAIKEIAQKTVTSILEQIHGPKDLVISPDIISPFDLVCGVSFLREVGVEKIYRLESGSSSPGSSLNCCLLVRSEVASFKIISDLVNADLAQNRSGIRYHILCIPRLTFECEQVLEEDGVYGRVSTINCPLYFFPLEVDLISFEQPNLFTTLFLDKDQTPIYNLASSLIQLQKIVGGQIPVIRSQGSVSKAVIKLMKVLECEGDGEFPDLGISSKPRKGERVLITKQSTVGNMVMMDRDVDYTSVLLSQLNYEGLLDETFGLTCSKVTFPKSVTKSNQQKKVTLNSNDTVFRDIRDCHLSPAFGKLKVKGVQLKGESEKRNQMDLNAMKDFVKNQLKTIQSAQASLSLHLSACEFIMEEKKDTCFVDRLRVERDLVSNTEIKNCLDVIETLIHRQVCPTICLRLLALLSVTNEASVSVREYKDLTRFFCHSFGYEHIVTFFNLKQLGLFTTLHAHMASFTPGQTGSLFPMLQLPNLTALNINNSDTSSSINTSTVSSSSHTTFPSSHTAFPSSHTTFPSSQSSLGSSAPGGNMTGAMSKSSVLSTSWTLFTSNNKYKTIVKKLALIPHLKEGESYNFQNPKDASFVFGGSYVPMVVPILELYIPANESGLNEECIKVIPGERYEISNKITNIRGASPSGEALIVFFVGGVTFAEVTAIRFWARKRGLKVLIATTGIINGNTLMKQLMPPKTASH